jgi:hypothetical protein
MIDQFPTVLRLKEPRRIPKAWTREEMNRLLESCRHVGGKVGDVGRPTGGSCCICSSGTPPSESLPRWRSDGIGSIGPPPMCRSRRKCARDKRPTRFILFAVTPWLPCSGLGTTRARWSFTCLARKIRCTRAIRSYAAWRACRPKRRRLSPNASISRIAPARGWPQRHRCPGSSIGRSHERKLSGPAYCRRAKALGRLIQARQGRNANIARGAEVARIPIGRSAGRGSGRVGLAMMTMPPWQPGPSRQRAGGSGSGWKRPGPLFYDRAQHGRRQTA